MTRLYRLLHFGQTRLMVCVITLSSILPALLLQHGVLSLRDFIVVSYPLQIHNTIFHPICKVFYYVNLTVPQYYIFASVGYHVGIGLVSLVYRSGICYHNSMGVKTKQREVYIEYMRLDEIQRDAANPKDHDLSALAESLERFGFVSPMGINEKTGKLLWGHGRLDDLVAFMDEGKPILEGLQVDEDGMWKVPVVRGVHLNQKDGTAYLISDNRQVELGGWNEPKLVETLIRIAGGDGGLRGTGFDGDDVDTLIRLYRPDLIDMPEDPGSQIDRAIELQEKWGTELGQIWELGNHRLAVGDCIDKAVVDAVIGSDKPKMLFTDPPYGIGLDTDYSGFPSRWENQMLYQDKYSKIAGDQEPFDVRKILELFNYVNEVFLWGADYYANTLPDNGIKGTWYVWDKREDETGDTYDRMFGSPFELCWGKKKRGKKIIRMRWAALFHGKATNGEKPTGSNRFHPTQKPVALARWFIERFSDKNDLIIDSFIGAGWTMIAAEQLNRICYGMEIEPKYCAVTLERMAGMSLEPRLITS